MSIVLEIRGIWLRSNSCHAHSNKNCEKPCRAWWSHIGIHVMDATFKVVHVGLSQAAAGICYCQSSPVDLNAVKSAAQWLHHSIYSLCFKTWPGCWVKTVKFRLRHLWIAPKSSWLLWPPLDHPHVNALQAVLTSAQDDNSWILILSRSCFELIDFIV